MRRILAAAFAAAISATALGALSFNGPFNLATGSLPDGIASGDFNGDGVRDLAVSSDNPDKVQVFFGTGGGNFAAPISYLTGSGTGAGSLRAADLDGDGDTDLLVALHNTNQVMALLNNGAGVFVTGATSSTGLNPVHLSVGDLNGDGRPDAVATNRDSNSLSVLTNNGSGGFAVATVATGQDPRQTAIGDLDGDGDQDVVVTNHDDRTITLFRNAGGVLGSPSTYSVGGGVRPEGVTIADLDADGDKDVAVATSDDTIGFVAVFRNNGGGTLSGPVNYNSGGLDPDSLVAADFDADGDMDIAVTNQDTNQLGLLANNGNATFAGAIVMPTGTRPGELTLGDLNNDGSSDIAVVNRDSNSVSIYLNTAAPVVLSPSAFSLFRGHLVSGGLGDLFSSDDARLVARAGFTAGLNEDQVQLIIEATSPVTTAGSITFKVESSVSTSGRVQRILLWDFTANQYVEVDSRGASLADSVAEVTVTTNASRFIAADGTVRAKVSIGPWANVVLQPWLARFDQVSWTIRN